MAFADKWDLCDVTSYWRILAARRRALRVAAPGRFIVVQAGQMRLIRVHDEPKLGLNIGPELTLESPTSSSHQGGELTVVPHYLNGVRWQRWAFTSWPARHHLRGLHRLPETPESLGPGSVDAGGVCRGEER